MPLSYIRALTSGNIHDEQSFRAEIASKLGPGTFVIPIGRARSGIYLLVSLAVKGSRRRVLMSPFTIPDVVTMVTLAGGEPVFFDFDPATTSCSLESLRSLMDDRTACALITHYHVNEPRLLEIAEICRIRGVYLFDDCALSFGGSIASRPIGTLTDGSVFSFSAFKLLNFVWGGMITTRDKVLGERIERTVGSWRRLGLRDYAVPAKACLSYDIATRPLLFGSLVFPLIRKHMQRSNRASGLEHTRIETTSLNPSLTSRPSLAALAEWCRKLGRIDEWLAHRQAVARVYRRRLAARMVSAGVPEEALNGSCFVNFPILVPPESRDAISRSLILSGYDVGRSLYPNVHKHPKFPTLVGQSRNVGDLVASTIYLPTHFGVSLAYADLLAQRVEEVVLGTASKAAITAGGTR